MAVSEATTKAEMKAEIDTLQTEFEDVSEEVQAALRPGDEVDPDLLSRYDASINAIVDWRTYWRQIREYNRLVENDTPSMVATTDNIQPADPWED